MITLPISKVIVAEDRAQVVRTGAIALDRETTELEVPGIATVACDRSLRVVATGATLRSARLVRRPRQKDEASCVQADVLRRSEERLCELHETQTAEATRLYQHEAALLDLRLKLLHSIAACAGDGEADPAQWHQALDQVDVRLRSNHAAQQECHDAVAATEEELRAVREAIGVVTEADPSQECLLRLSLEGAGPVQLSVYYQVPCALWRPAYRATLFDGSVRVECEAVVWQRSGEDWTDVALEISTVRTASGVALPRLVENRLETRPKAADEKQRVDVQVREQDIQRAGERGSGAAEVPGLDDGGETRLLRSQRPVTIPSDGMPHRVRLSEFNAPATLEFVSRPEHSPLVFAVAKFTNAGQDVMLAGPVSLVRNAGFVGRALMPFSAPGEPVTLSFGSEDGVRVSRLVSERTEESGLSRRYTTTRAVELYISNTSRLEKPVRIEERMIVSEIKDVQVRVVPTQCDPPPTSLSTDGIATLETRVSAQGTRKALFTWEVSAASKVSGI